MSRNIVLHNKPTKGKDVSALTYEQVTDPDNYVKKRSTPATLVVDGIASTTKGENTSKSLKPRIVTPIHDGPLDNSDAYTEIPKPAPLVQNNPTLKLKTYNGKKSY